MSRSPSGSLSTSLCAIALGAFAALLAAPHASAQQTPTALDAAVIEKRHYYNEQFPEILFLTLKGGSAWVEDVTALAIILGHEPASLDYEHPADLRADLMALSFERVQLMLQYRAPSASLFRADDPKDWPENICVITLDPCAIASDDEQATRHLLDLSEEEWERIAPELRLQCTDYLDFVFDHEAYHCLSSLYNGPQPRSFEPLWAQYWHHRMENGADAFAIAMHLKQYGRVTRFAQNLQRVRGAALFEADVDHWTSRAIAAVIQDEPGQFETLSVQEIFDYATGVRDRIVPDYDSYLSYRASAVTAMAQIGISEDVRDELRQDLADVQADPQLTTDILRHSQTCRRTLLGEQDSKPPCPTLTIRSD
jgi:hypothetical protein